MPAVVKQRIATQNILIEMFHSSGQIGSVFQNTSIGTFVLCDAFFSRCSGLVQTLG